MAVLRKGNFHLYISESVLSNVIVFVIVIVILIVNATVNAEAIVISSA